ncbi:MAG: hypothetical protein QME94_18320, partial [Anaerolineae bacterium]|nr:hypothetical protein [Anaerolineae bacterium]
APESRAPYAYVVNNPVNGVDPSGEQALLGAIVGGVIGGAASGIAYVIRNPGRSLGEYVRDPGLQRSVASGAAGGLVSGLTIGLLGAPTSFLGAVGVGAAGGFSGGAAQQLIENLLTPGATWHEDLLPAAVLGGLIGGATGGAFYTGRQLVLRATLKQQLLRILRRASQEMAGTGHVAGTRIHGECRRQVSKLRIWGVSLEESFLRQRPANYGAPGGVRLDVVKHPLLPPRSDRVVAVYDFKTAGARLSQARIQQISKHLPNPAPVIEIRIRP